MEQSIEVDPMHDQEDGKPKEGEISTMSSDVIPDATSEQSQ